ncbi:MAG: alpha/beta hydrolase-fold protein [Chloroflexota bacterium]
MSTQPRADGIRDEADAIAMIDAAVQAARKQSPDFKELLLAAVDGGPTITDEMLGRSGPVAVSGEDFLFLLRTERDATVTIDDRPPAPMTPVPGTGYSYRLEQLRLGTTHNFLWHVGGHVMGTMGGIMARSVAGYNPGSYPIPGAKRGTLSEKRTIASPIYGGAASDYWVYTNPGIDAERGAPVMVWLDGVNHVGLLGAYAVRMQTVTDNLVHRGLIPPMVHILISPGVGGSLSPATVLPGTTPESEVRSIQYDTVNDDFGRHIVEEVLPEVEKTYKLRQDGYSRAITGQSSGGIAAFKVCWWRPNEFARAYSSIGSFTALQWHPEQHLDGGYIFPFLVRCEEKRNIRVWLSDGAEDIDFEEHIIPSRLHRAGSWPLANLQMAQALKIRGYDFHFRYGTASHNSAQWALDLPESLVWLWRGYDPDKTSETFEQEASERAKPLYRVGVTNRDAW